MAKQRDNFLGMRLTPLEEERIIKVREHLSKQSGGAAISISHVMHVLINRGYQSLEDEIEASK